MIGFSFDADKHIYTYDGRLVPSVTSILKSVGLIDDRFYTGFGKERGRAIHSAIYLDHYNDLDLSSLDPAIQGHFDAWLRFKAETGFSVLQDYCEQPLYHPDYGFAGTPDMVGIINGKHALIDLKSGAVSSWAAYQVAAYAELLKTNHKLFIQKQYALKLDEAGIYKLVPLGNHTNNFNVFLSALNVSRAINSGKVLAG